MKKILTVLSLFIAAQTVKAQTVTITNSKSCTYIVELYASNAFPLCPIASQYHAAPINIPPATGGVSSVTTVNPSSAPWVGPIPSGAIVWDFIIVGNNPTGGGDFFKFGICTPPYPPSGTLHFDPSACIPNLPYTWSSSGGNISINF